jgi:hypothetical protein
MGGPFFVSGKAEDAAGWPAASCQDVHGLVDVRGVPAGALVANGFAATPVYP